MMVDPKWIEKMKHLMDQKLPIDVTLPYQVSANWLVAELSRRNIPFRLQNIGAGVRRLTTDTEHCPFCGQKVKL
jgi:hypothetical protein